MLHIVSTLFCKLFKIDYFCKCQKDIKTKICDAPIYCLSFKKKCNCFYTIHNTNSRRKSLPPLISFKSTKPFKASPLYTYSPQVKYVTDSNKALHKILICLKPKICLLVTSQNWAPARFNFFILLSPQPALTCSTLTTEKLEHGVKYVQS